MSLFPFVCQLFQISLIAGESIVTFSLLVCVLFYTDIENSLELILLTGALMTHCLFSLWLFEVQQVTSK